MSESNLTLKSIHVKSFVLLRAVRNLPSISGALQCQQRHLGVGLFSVTPVNLLGTESASSHLGWPLRWLFSAAVFQGLVLYLLHPLHLILHLLWFSHCLSPLQMMKVSCARSSRPGQMSHTGHGAIWLITQFFIALESRIRFYIFPLLKKDKVNHVSWQGSTL